MQVNFSTRLSIETAKRLDAYCKETEKSKASITEEAIKKYLDKQEKK